MKAKDETVVPKDNLFKPIEFWSDIIKIVDGRVKEIATTYGFGEVTVKLKVRDNDIKIVTFSEEVSVKQK